MSIKNHDLFLFRSLTTKSRVSKHTDIQTSIIENMQSVEVKLLEQTIEFLLPYSFTERFADFMHTDVETTDIVYAIIDEKTKLLCNKVLCYVDAKDKNTINIYVYQANKPHVKEAYKAHLARALSKEMTQKLKSTTIDSATIDSFRRISQNGNVFYTLGLVEPECAGIIFDFSCPNSFSDLWRDIFVEIINSVKCMPTGGASSESLSPKEVPSVV